MAFSPKVIWGVVKQASARCGLANVAPHDLRRYAVSRPMPNRCEALWSGGDLCVSVIASMRHNP